MGLGFDLEFSAEEPKQIAQPIQVRQNEGADVLAIFGHANDVAFGSAGDGTGEVKRGTGGVSTGDGPIAEQAGEGFEGVDLGSEGFDHGFGDGGIAFPAFRRGGEGGTDFEQILLDQESRGGEGPIGADGTGVAEGGVKLVDSAVSFDAESAFGDAFATGEAGLAGIAEFGCNGLQELGLGWFDYEKRRG